MKYLSFALCVLLFVGCAKKEIEILHIGDSHAYLGGMDENYAPVYDENSSFGGFARLKTELDKHKNALKIDAGDRFQGTLYFALFGAEPLIKLDEAMEFSALTLGNHEFDRGCEYLSSYLNALKTPVLAANIKTSQNCALDMQKIKPFIIKEINGLKVGIIGISHDNPKDDSSACDCVSLIDTKEAINEQIKALKAQNINIIVLVTHLGLNKDMKLAKSLEDIDIIIGGHTHSYLGNAKGEKSEGSYPLMLKSPKNEPVLIAHAKDWTEYLGQLKVRFDENGVISAFSGEPKRLTGKQDEKINEILRPFNEEIKARSKTIANNEIAMNDGLMECRQAECLSALLLARAAIETSKEIKPQIAFINSGTARMALPKGDISELDLLVSFPFGNKIVIKELSGDEIKKALENGVAKKSLKNLSSMLQPANLKYTINTQKPPFERISNIEVKIDGKWQKLDFSKRYKVAMNDYIAQGKSGFDMLKNAKTIKALEITDLEAISDYVKKHTPIKQIERGLINFKF